MKLSKILTALAFVFGLAGCKSSPKEPTPEPEPEVVYTAESVAEEYNANLVEAGYSFLQVEWDEDYEEYGLAVSFGESSDESEENLGSAAYTLAMFLPEYMSEGLSIYGNPESEGYYDLFGDGSCYYYAGFATEDESVEAVVISYIYSSLLIAQISIYDVAE